MGLNLCSNPFGEIIATVKVENHVRAFTRKDFAECGANAACASGYERTLTFKQ